MTEIHDAESLVQYIYIEIIISIAGSAVMPKSGFRPLEYKSQV